MTRPSRSAVLARALRLALRRTRHELRQAKRENVRLRNALLEMLYDDEQTLLTSYWPWGDFPPGKPRLCGILAAEIEPDERARAKRARKALGLPWWGGLDYEDGLQPGRGR